MSRMNSSGQNQRGPGASDTNMQDAKKGQVNPYVAYVKQFDPDNTMNDGRSYVGGARHHLDRPTHSGGRPTPHQPADGWSTTPSGQRASPSQQQHQQPHADNTRNNHVQLPRQQHQNNQPNQQSSSGFGFQATTRSQSNRSGRDGANTSRWKGQTLSTPSTLPAEFFKTAKPLHPPAERSPPAQSGPPATGLTHGQVGSASPMPSETNGRSRNEASGSQNTLPTLDGRSADDSWAAQGLKPWPNTNQQQQHQRQRGSPQRDSRLAAMDVDQEAAPSDRAESVAPRIYSDDEGNVDGDLRRGGSNSSVAPSPAVSRHGYSMEASRQGSEEPGDPLFLQYPIGDGCFVVVAMYVERDAHSALRRFPNLPRTRQSSSHKSKTMDDMAALFKEALEDEKKNITG
ncbi:hypothetical protein BGZ99_004509 [Dissophora globulifera]|uniref:Uncharacterized protein n=1 Tax=Dissophora globulifera TaxID=979702 RepID=A0A9P6RK35_9FUNG|nr:hypothetical protein BGZ99_004509 [Dissophora globulifera]